MRRRPPLCYTCWLALQQQYATKLLWCSVRFELFRDISCMVTSEIVTNTARQTAEEVERSMATWSIRGCREAESAPRLQLETGPRQCAAALRRQLLQQRGALVCGMRRMHSTLWFHTKPVPLDARRLLHLLATVQLVGIAISYPRSYEVLSGNGTVIVTAHLPSNVACLLSPACCSCLHRSRVVCLPHNVVLQWWLWRLGSCPDHLQPGQAPL